MTGGLRLKTVSMEYKKVVAWIPGPPVQTESILKRLQRQNKDMVTQGQRVFEPTEKEKGIRLVLTVDTPNLEVLKRLS